MMREKLRKNHRKYHQPCDFGVPFWRHLQSTFALRRVLFPTCFSKPLRGTPKSDFGRQNEAKECQNEPKWSPKGRQNGAELPPTHYQSTQVLFTAITPLRHYFFNELKNN